MRKQNDNNIYSQSGKKHKGGKIAAIIIIIVLVLALAAAAWIWFFNRDLIKDFLPQEETTAPTTVETTTAEPTTAAPTEEPVTIAEVEVPNVTQRPAKDAYYLLQNAGLRYTVVREYSEDINSEYVISQEPEAGEVIKQNEPVLLHISKGIDNPKEVVTVPGSKEETQPTTEKSGEKKKQSGKYILEGSDTRYISRSEVEKLDKNEQTLALNEIFARHGRRFNTPEIQAYFDKQSWYKGTLSPSEFDESVLSAIERSNINTILNVMD